MGGRGKPKMELVLVAELDSENWGATRLVVTVCKDTPDGLRNPLFGYLRDEPGGEYDGFQIGAYASPDAGVYGYRCGYKHSVPVELEQMETQVKVLRKLDRARDAMHARFGWPETFGDYVCQTAHILGITRFFVRSDARYQEVTRERYRPTDAAGLKQWVADHTPKPAVAASAA